MATPVAEVRDHVSDQPFKHSDATGWRQGGEARTLWTIASATATAFFITPSGSMAALRGLFAKIKGVLVSDRGTQFGFWSMDKRQICWAHLIRRFVGFSERSGAARELGENLLLCTQTLFMHFWHQVRDGTMARATFQRIVEESLGPIIERHLQAGVSGGLIPS